MAINSGFAEVSGGKLYYQSAGSGPALLCIHGFGGSGDSWAGQFNFFADRYQVIAPDLRGYGRSTDFDANEAFVHTDDIKALLDHMEVESAHVMGSSMGGRIATHFALAHSGMTDSLILKSAAIGGFEFSDEWYDHWPSTEKAARDGLEYTVEWAKQTYLNNPMFAAALERDDLREGVTRSLLEQFNGHQFVNNAEILDFDPPDYTRLSEIKVPTLIITGSRDIADIRHIACLYESIANASHIEYEGVGHLVSHEAPERFNRDVSNFLSGPALRL